jgi:hypothetical protein
MDPPTDCVRPHLSTSPRSQPLEIFPEE